ncbi:MAG TPA: NADH-quinone oxidoreductase subunit J [Thermoanaerobaculia bacterium]|nr:NADH-quinone oxidoreductase subunit J [Thermoanaerobaculia bacterium]HQR67624.1 NADH-quinone oxidoreductase subunit J [Thermoanaerobaculia bacterium]
MTPALFLFWVLAAVVVIGAVGVIVMRQPVHSALFLLLSFVGVAGLFVLASAEFLAAVQILVYAGGIMVLFLFTIMLVNVRRQATESFLHRQAAVAVLFGLVFYAIVGGLLVGEAKKLASVAADPANLATVAAAGVRVAGNSQAVGWALYREYFLPFEVASVFLLVAMIGAVVLGKRTMEKVD